MLNLAARWRTSQKAEQQVGTLDSPFAMVCSLLSVFPLFPNICSCCSRLWASRVTFLFVAFKDWRKQSTLSTGRALLSPFVEMSKSENAE